MDLNFQTTTKFRMPPKIQEHQFAQLVKLQRQHARETTAAEHFVNMSPQPASVTEFLAQSQKIVEDHRKLQHVSMMDWRRDYFMTLPSYNLINFAHSRLLLPGAFRSFKQRASAGALEAVRHWEWADFMMHSYNQECTCNGGAAIACWKELLEGAVFIKHHKNKL